MNLQERQILKLASLGSNYGNLKNVVDALKAFELYCQVLSGMKVAWASKESGGSAGHPCRSSRAEADTSQYDQHCRRSPPCGLLLQSHVCSATIRLWWHAPAAKLCSANLPMERRGSPRDALLWQKMKPFLRLFTTTYPRCGETDHKRSQEQANYFDI
ncbi:uncharacterized protein [Triticum aestivum]|uniref:uncharacterized protein isoform X2 n=1 Tax=Triticum aestivum TaxID=4565 RepID=UPI001D01D493|nr:uncharacterized protein LOC123040809 isoform X2 [Triticum aestivum]